MNTILNRRVLPAMLLLTVALLTSFPTMTLADEPSQWSVKTGLLLIDSQNPFSIDKPSGGTVQAGGNAELGVAIAVEYRISKRIGLEAGVAYAKSPDVDEKQTGNRTSIGEGPSFAPLLLGANFHLLESANLDVYVGPRVAYVSFGDFDLTVDGEKTAFEVDNEFAWGATLGAAYRFGNSPWQLIAEATYLDVDMKITNQFTDESTSDSFDPVMFNFGVSYSFN